MSPDPEDDRKPNSIAATGRPMSMATYGTLFAVPNFGTFEC